MRKILEFRAKETRKNVENRTGGHEKGDTPAEFVYAGVGGKPGVSPFSFATINPPNCEPTARFACLGAESQVAGRGAQPHWRILGLCEPAG